MAYGEWNGHVIEIQGGGLAEICTLSAFLVRVACAVYTNCNHF